MVIGPDGQPMGSVPASVLAAAAAATGEGGEDDEDGDRAITDLVEQPAKVMRIGSMIRQLLEEVKAAPLDEASRNRLKEIHQASIKELETGLAPELVEELERLSLPFTEDSVPSESELRIAQAQLVGWLEGLFHGIQTAIYAQQMAARAQFEQMRKALPPGAAMPGARPGSAARRRGLDPASRRVGRDVPLAGCQPLAERDRSRTKTRPSRPTITSATPGAASRVRLSGSASSTLVNSAASASGCGVPPTWLPVPRNFSTLPTNVGGREVGPAAAIGGERGAVHGDEEDVPPVGLELAQSAGVLRRGDHDVGGPDVALVDRLRLDVVRRHAGTVGTRGGGGLALQDSAEDRVGGLGGVLDVPRLAATGGVRRHLRQHDGRAGEQEGDQESTEHAHISTDHRA